MHIFWLIVIYCAIALAVGLVYAFGASVGYGKGWKDGRGTAHLRLRPRPAALGYRGIQTPANQPRRMRRRGLRILVATVTLGALVAVAGAALAVEPQPDSVVWRARVALETLPLLVTTSPARRAALHTELLARRVSDLQTLLAHDAEPGAIASVVTRLSAHAEGAGLETAREPATADGSAFATRQRVETLVRHRAVLATLQDVACRDDGSGQATEVCASVRSAFSAATSALAAVAASVPDQPDDGERPPTGPAAAPGTAQPPGPARGPEGTADDPGRGQPTPPGQSGAGGGPPAGRRQNPESPPSANPNAEAPGRQGEHPDEPPD